MKLKSYNPSNNEILGEIECTSLSEVEDIVKNSRYAFNEWGYVPLDERIRYINLLYNLILDKNQELAELVTKEMGMPINESLYDIESGLDYIKWYVDNAPKILSEKITYEDEVEIDKIIFEPKGVVAIIIAWNFPFSSFVWQAIPNLLVGNTVIVKHSEYVPMCSRYIYELVSSVLPNNVYSTVYGAGDVGSELVNQDIDMICFTGSTKTGQQLYKIAAEKFIPVVLECGGSAPGIVFEDADIDSVIEAVYINKFTNNGQICDGQKRLIVHESKFDEVCEKLKKLISEKKIGNPLDSTVDLGPIVSNEQVVKLEQQVKDAIQKGATIVYGGKRLENNSNYYLPTILTNINKDMKVYNEEIFGPVIPIIKFKTIEEAINIANDTIYGLGGYVYTTNSEIFNKVVRSLKTGMIALNNLYYLKPCNPFGGYKKSGLGKNNSQFSIEQLCNIKVVTYEKEKLMSKIKGIILDVDGVLIGEKIGFNSPYPNEKVIEKLKEIKQKGISISLCTAKPYFSIDYIIKSANLNNYHIADGGAVVINPIENKIVEKHIIDKTFAKTVIKTMVENQVYTEFYTVNNYYIDKQQECDITKKHNHILQAEPILLDNIVDEIDNYDITKIMPIALDEEDKERVEKIFNSLNTNLTLSWGVHPVANPLKFAIITASGISKEEGAKVISKSNNVDFKNMLAVGDSTSDWQFINLCSYGAAMGNASDKLKELVKTKDYNHYYIGKDVDENGIIDILDYFIEQAG